MIHSPLRSPHRVSAPGRENRMTAISQSEDSCEYLRGVLSVVDQFDDSFDDGAIPRAVDDLDFLEAELAAGPSVDL